MPRMARFGVLTGGGDCPGLNAVIRGVVRAGVNRYGHEIVGFRYGWAGVLEGTTVELTPQSTAGILHRGGTILGTSRTNPFKDEADGTAAVRATLEAKGIDAIIPIGGEDTLGVAGRLSAEGIPVVGVPKTIDNDLAGTDVTFGFNTAVQIATDAIDRLHTTAESHNRVIVVEVMGRHAGWIAAYSGLAGGADVILVPERPFDIDEVCESIKRRHAGGRTFSIVVVSEGALPRDGTGITTSSEETDAFGHARLGGIGVALEREIEARTGFETRMTILGHVQRGGTPTAYDRVLATRFGVRAIEAADAGDFGTMVALRGTDIVLVPLEDAVAEPKLLDEKLYATAEVFFG
jgi:ATP-dependent phosphofructokinase / diphosphate-dependent phosphofructokinase